MANTAKVVLGRMYSRGEGVPQDYQKAIKWFREAAEQGDSEWGQLELGRIYGDGAGVTQDYEQAMKWLRKAAEHGNSFAQEELGIMQDQQEVIKLRKAAEQGEPRAQYRLGFMYERGRGVTRHC